VDIIHQNKNYQYFMYVQHIHQKQCVVLKDKSHIKVSKGGEKVKVYSFLTSAVNGVKLSGTRNGRFTPRNKPPLPSEEKAW
jgi:hypothetical protein